MQKIYESPSHHWSHSYFGWFGPRERKPPKIPDVLYVHTFFFRYWDIMGIQESLLFCIWCFMALQPWLIWLKDIRWLNSSKINVVSISGFSKLESWQTGGPWGPPHYLEVVFSCFFSGKCRRISSFFSWFWMVKKPIKSAGFIPHTTLESLFWQTTLWPPEPPDSDLPQGFHCWVNSPNGVAAGCYAPWMLADWGGSSKVIFEDTKEHMTVKSHNRQLVC